MRLNLRCEGISIAPPNLEWFGFDFLLNLLPVTTAGTAGKQTFDFRNGGVMGAATAPDPANPDDLLVTFVDLHGFPFRRIRCTQSSKPRDSGTYGCGIPDWRYTGFGHTSQTEIRTGTVGRSA
jgi:hypothetical protein